jgi:hypothetical protein
MLSCSTLTISIDGSSRTRNRRKCRAAAGGMPREPALLQSPRPRFRGVLRNTSQGGHTVLPDWPSGRSIGPVRRQILVCIRVFWIAAPRVVSRAVTIRCLFRRLRTLRQHQGSIGFVECFDLVCAAWAPGGRLPPRSGTLDKCLCLQGRCGGLGHQSGHRLSATRDRTTPRVPGLSRMSPLRRIHGCRRRGDVEPAPEKPGDPPALAVRIGQHPLVGHVQDLPRGA